MSKKQELYPNCLRCSTSFKAIKSNIEKGKAKFCSRSCASRSYGETVKRTNKECRQCAKSYYPSHTDNRGFCSKECGNESRRGIATGRKMIHTDETKKKISIGLKLRYKTEIPYNRGKKMPQRSGVNHHFWGKKRPEMSGKNNPNWKDGASERRGQRFTGEYKMWRKHVFDRDNYTCQDCGKQGGYLHADHKKSYAEHPELRLNLSNGQTLCMSCHYLKTYGRVMPESVKTFGVGSKKARIASF